MTFIADQILDIKRRRESERPTPADNAWAQAAADLGRAPRRYYKLRPLADSERTKLLADGLNETENPEEFEPRRVLLKWNAEVWVENFKRKHGRPPDGYFPYDEVVEKKTTVHYPMDVFDNTLIGEWVERATEGNFIPPEFFAEAMKTMIGAVAGHRIVNEDDHDQEARFYTVMLSTEGGIGKSSAIKWTQELFTLTGLIEKNGKIRRQNVGTVRGEYGSGRAMIEGFEQHPRVIQIYDELASFVSGLAISGSGDALLGAVNQMYDSNDPPKSALKGKIRPPDAPKECHNSILACSIVDKWNGMFVGSSSDNSGFFQRLNIIASDETRTVKKLKKPEIGDLALRLYKKLEALEYQRVLIRYTPEADATMETWFNQIQVETKADAADVRGRLQVLCQRNCSILAWLFDGLTIDDLQVKPSLTVDFESGKSNADDVSRLPEVPTERIIEVTREVMERATRLSDYQLRARRAHQPVIGDSPWAVCENHIAKVLQTAKKKVTRGVLNKRINAAKYGIRMVNGALDNLHKERRISVEDVNTKTKSTKTYEWMGEEND